MRKRPGPVGRRARRPSELPGDTKEQLLAVAEYITKTHAICMKCGQPANYSQRTFESEERVAVGASDKYEARCRACFVPHADAPTVHD